MRSHFVKRMDRAFRVHRIGVEHRTFLERSKRKNHVFGLIIIKLHYEEIGSRNQIISYKSEHSINRSVSKISTKLCTYRLTYSAFK